MRYVCSFNKKDGSTVELHCPWMSIKLATSLDFNLSLSHSLLLTLNADSNYAKTIQWFAGVHPQWCSFIPNWNEWSDCLRLFSRWSFCKSTERFHIAYWRWKIIIFQNRAFWFVRKSFVHAVFNQICPAESRTGEKSIPACAVCLIRACEF